VKDLDLKAHWADEKLWIRNDFTGNDRWLRERAMHAQLSSVGSAHNIVEYLGATTYTNKRSLRLYMEYCPHGDLADLLCKHAKFDRANKGLMLDDNDEPVPEVKIPVRALWTFFRDLAKAACIMHLGHNPLDSGAQEPANWTEIIHHDIKPGNIFLAAPLSKTGRGIPVCKFLYIRQNDGGQLCNRIVVKDTDYKFGQYHNNIWNANWFWVKHRNEQDVPVEVKTMSDLRGRVGAEHAVKILNWHIATDRQLYRLYLEVRWHMFTHARIMD
jgi:serine/threonine protein kinase